MALQVALQQFLHSQNPSTRAKILAKARDPIFIPRYTIPLARERELALLRLQAVCSLNVVSIADFKTNPSNIFTAQETLGYLDGSLATKFTVQFNLFGGTLVALGTERHLTMLKEIDRLQAVGCFALTELGYGNNAVEMETTATWDQTNRDFVLNSPTIYSHKYWITNGALHAQWAVVFAQLYIAGNNEGVHAFLVRIRNEDMSTVSGVDIEDIGMKMGLNGIDNARLAFDHLRIPRESLLNRYSDVSPEGVFTSTVSKRRDRFLKVADRLLSGRICIAAMSMGAMKLMSVGIIRFFTQRLSTGPTGDNDTPIFDYQLQQNAIFPLIAKTLCLNITLNFIRGEFHKGPSELVKWCCSIKAMVVHTFERLSSVGRERMGGMGFLSCNRMGAGIEAAQSGFTAEGDASVLQQKVAKDLLTDVMKGQRTPLELKYCPKRQLPELQNVTSLELLFELIKVKEEQSLAELYTSISEKMAAQRSLFDVWMTEESERVQATAWAYGDRLCAEQSLSALTQRPDLKALLEPPVTLVLLDIVKNGLSWFLIRGIISRAAAQGVEEAWTLAVKRFGVVIREVVEGFGVPEELIFAPAAGNLIEFYSKKNEGEHLPQSKL
jgi:acyl-CoA oxidase